MTIRPPAVAGSFYPDRPDRLSAAIERFLAAAQARPAVRAPKAVIVPHAGYPYSGPVAGHAFAALRVAAAAIRRVVLLGPAHRVPIRGLAVPAVAAFRTRLGDVAPDRAVIDAVGALPQVRCADAPHRDEHALEVELPFLQAILGEFALVPLAVGQTRAAEVAEVLALLWGGEETAIVISSDLSHYHDYGTAQRRRGDRRSDRGAGPGPWAGRCLRSSADRRPAARGKSQRHGGRSAGSAQLGRHRRATRPRRRLRRLGIPAGRGRGGGA